MSKEELIEKLEHWIVQVNGLRVFLYDLRSETLVTELFLHGAMGFLITACDYLSTNLEEIRNKIRMS